MIAHLKEEPKDDADLLDEHEERRLENIGRNNNVHAKLDLPPMAPAPASSPEKLTSTRVQRQKPRDVLCVVKRRERYSHKATAHPETVQPESQTRLSARALPSPALNLSTPVVAEEKSCHGSLAGVSGLPTVAAKGQPLPKGEVPHPILTRPTVWKRPRPRSPVKLGGASSRALASPPGERGAAHLVSEAYGSVGAANQAPSVQPGQQRPDPPPGALIAAPLATSSGAVVVSASLNDDAENPFANMRLASPFAAKLVSPPSPALVPQAGPEPRPPGFRGRPSPALSAPSGAFGGHLPTWRARTKLGEFDGHTLERLANWVPAMSAFLGGEDSPHKELMLSQTRRRVHVHNSMLYLPQLAAGMGCANPKNAHCPKFMAGEPLTLEHDADSVIQRGAAWVETFDVDISVVTSLKRALRNFKHFKNWALENVVDLPMVRPSQVPRLRHEGETAAHDPPTSPLAGDSRANPPHLRWRPHQGRRGRRPLSRKADARVRSGPVCSC